MQVLFYVIIYSISKSGEIMNSIDETVKLEVLEKFLIDGEVVSANRFGSGHINKTYLIKTNIGNKYVLQSINKVAFKDINQLMNNIKLVTEHIIDKVKENKENPYERTLTLIKTHTGEPYFEEDGSFYRIFNYIDGITYQWVETPEIFFESAVGFGSFVNLLSDFDTDLLVETIPNFHNTRQRFYNFKKSLEIDRLKRSENCKHEIAEYIAREFYCDRIIGLLESGKMPYRVTHNDTKLNNVLFNPVDSKYLAVIDLDTVMKGSMCYDFGDSIRFGCNVAGEDETNLDKVKFDLDLFEQYAKGFISQVCSSITEVELNNLAFGAILMTYECGMRFLTDHIDGDVYFGIAKESHNLDRARTQLKLVEEMEKKLKTMKEIINNVYQEYKN